MVEPARRVAIATGVAFLALGVIQFATVMLPMRLGVPEWELAAFGELSGSLGPAAIGVALLGALGRFQPSMPLTAASLGGSIFFGVVGVLGLVVVGLNVPMVLTATATNEVGALAFRVAVAKMLILTAIYITMFFVQAYLVAARK